MVKHCLKLGPVYSRLADEKDLDELRKAGLGQQLAKVQATGLQLRRHQARSWRAYADPEIDVVFDLALTGDGKSLAGQLPLLTQGKKAMLLYPTNELIEDQEHGLLKNLDKFKLKYKPQKLNSESITEKVEQSFSPGASRVSEMLLTLTNTNCILSNPDLFHLMSSFNYGSDKDSREFVFQIPDNLNYFVFDEFHIFGQPQAIAVLNVLNYHRVHQRGHHLKYVFLSATPTASFEVMLKRSGFRIEKIGNEADNYSPIAAEGYTSKPIVQPVNLQLHSLSQKGAFVWAEEHLAELEEFYQSDPTSKGVFIVNSVATAKRLTAFFQAKWGVEAVGEITGLTNVGERERARNKSSSVRFIIATSTVDIGVDFEINLLIFESTNLGTFIQRLGRLGRHPKWQEYRAYALLPEWRVQLFREHFPDEDASVERVQFLDKIRASEKCEEINEAELKPIFRPEQDFKNYGCLWGGLQTAHIIQRAEKLTLGKHKKDEGESKYVDEPLRQQYNQAYGYKDKDGKRWIDRQVGCYQIMLRDKEEDKAKQASAKMTTKERRNATVKPPSEKRHIILEELNSFRGRSPLTCGIFDETDSFFKHYDLFFLLANTKFTVMEAAEFERRAGNQFKRHKSHELGIYLRVHSYTEERDSFDLINKKSLKGKANQVSVLDNFWIENSRVLSRQIDNRVNHALEKLNLVCLTLQETPAEFKARNRLGPLFPVYSVQDGSTPSLNYSIVFGLEALLAHSLVFQKKADDDEEALPIC